MTPGLSLAKQTRAEPPYLPIWSNPDENTRVLSRLGDVFFFQEIANVFPHL